VANSHDTYGLLISIVIFTLAIILFRKLNNIYFFYSQNNNARFFIPFCSASGRPTSNARTQSYGAEGNVGHDNPLYGQTFRLPNEEPEYLEIGQLQQPSVGFPNPHFDPRDHYQPLDNPYGRSNHVYGRINLKGERGQSEV